MLNMTASTKRKESFMDENYKPTRNRAVVEKSVEPEAVLYNSKTFSVHIVNDTAHQIWKLSNGRNTIRDIEKKIKKKYRLDEELSIEKDIKKTLAEFKEKGLIV